MSGAPTNPPAPPPEPIGTRDADGFYVGYLPAPQGVARFARRSAEFLAALAVVIAVATAAAQRPPGRGEFHAGEASRITVTAYASPVPLCLWQDGQGVARWLLVVGERKFGTPEAFERLPLGAPTEAQGVVIAARGEASPGCFEFAAAQTGGAAATSRSEGAQPVAATERALGRRTLRGQIIDPKCHFGAMKPGEGKVHRACAVRCLSGGIPAVMMVRERDEASAATPSAPGERFVFYILLDIRDELANGAVLQYVAENVEITGETSRLVAPDGGAVGDDSLRVLRFDPGTIKRLP